MHIILVILSDIWVIRYGNHGFGLKPEFAFGVKYWTCTNFSYSQFGSFGFLKYPGPISVTT